jgi:hypothetical protein
MVAQTLCARTFDLAIIKGSGFELASRFANRCWLHVGAPFAHRAASKPRFNDKRYYYQGIGRFAPEAAYARGITDLRILADLIPMSGYAFGTKPTSIDAAIYGFIANIYFLPIETPLKQFVEAHPNLIRHCTAIHHAIGCELVS